MIIYHIIDKLIGGGAETQLRLLVNNSSRDFIHNIIYHKPGGEELINDNVSLHYIDSNSKVVIISDMFKIFRTKELNIIQLWLPEYMCIPASFYGFFNGVKVISGDRRAPIQKIGYLFFRDRLKVLQHLFSDVVVSNFPLQKYGLITKLFLKLKSKAVIYNAVKSDREYVNYCSTNTRKVNLVYLGRLVEHKRPHLVIKLLKDIIKSDNNFEYSASFFGEGPELIRLQKLCKDLDLIDSVSFYGFENNWDSVLSKKNALNILIFPTTNEGMPNVLMEAASSRMLFIACGLPEILVHFSEIEKSCLPRYYSSDIEQLAVFKDYLTNLISNSFDLNALMDKTENIVSRYSIERNIDNWESLYRQLRN